MKNPFLFSVKSVTSVTQRLVDQAFELDPLASKVDEQPYFEVLVHLKRGADDFLGDFLMEKFSLAGVSIHRAEFSHRWHRFHRKQKRFLHP